MVLVEDFERRLGQILDLVNRSKGLVVVEDYELGNRSNQPKEEYHEIHPYNDIVRLSGNKNKAKGLKLQRETIPTAPS